MAKRNSKKSNQRTNNGKAPTSSGSTVDSVEWQVVALAEQVGRIVGTVQAKAEGWFDRKALSDQLAGVRDTAADMVQHLADAVEKAPLRAGTRSSRRSSTSLEPSRASSSDGRSGGSVDAPGKKHRKPAPTTPGVKHSDTRIAKMKFANETRRRGPTRQQ